MKKIAVIGDSHSSLYSDVKSRNRGVWEDENLNNIFDVKWIGPVTMWRLCRDQEKFVDLDSDIKHNQTGIEITTKCEEGQDVLLVFGEIDVRCNILKFGYENYKKTVDDMCDKLEIFIKKYYDRFNIHIQSIVPTIYRKNFGDKKPLFPFVGNDDERKEVTIYFNKKLKELCNKLNIGYFDIFDIYSDENSMMTPEKSDYIVHAMKSKDLESYIKKYFKIKLDAE
jgi:hypothetical protein